MTTRIMKQMLALCSVSALFIKAIAQPGSLDPSFAQQGSYIFRPDTQTVCYESILDSDGRIMLCGWMEMANDIDRYPLLARLLANGLPDATFGVGGYIDGSTMPEFISFPYFGTIDQQSNGQYLTLAFDNFDNHKLFRFNNDGSLDQTFNGAQFLLNNPNIYRSAIDSQDRLVVSCYSFPDDPIYGGYANMTVMRFTAEGALDASFGAGGFVTLGNLENDERCYDVTVDAFDNVYVAGYRMQSQGGSPFAVALLFVLDTNGQLRADFADGGVYQILEPGVNHSFHGLDVEEQSGDVFVSGFQFNPQAFVQRGMLVKLTSTGQPVASFGSNGVHMSDDTDAEYSYVTQLNDGNLAVAARVNNGDFGRDARVSIVSPLGETVGSFGVNGHSSLFDISHGDDNPLDIMQDEQGRILIAGYGFALDDIPALGVQWGEKGFIACYQYSPQTVIDEHVQQVGEIYPNPASDLVFVPGGEGMSYRLTDATGKLLDAGRIQTGSFIVRDLSAGLYLLTVGSEVHKLIVE